MLIIRSNQNKQLLAVVLNLHSDRKRGVQEAVVLLGFVEVSGDGGLKTNVGVDAVVRKNGRIEAGIDLSLDSQFSVDGALVAESESADVGVLDRLEKLETNLTAVGKVQTGAESRIINLKKLHTFSVSASTF